MQDLNPSHLSRIAVQATSKPARVDLEIYFEAINNRYDKVDNPTGSFPMNMAENKLVWDMLSHKIKTISREEEIPEWVAGYGDPLGVESFREAIAEYLGEFLFGCPVDKDSLGLSAGLTSVIELTAFLLADKGDVAVIPAPSYSVYTADIGNLAGVKRYDLQTHTELSALSGGLLVSTDHLEKAWREIQEAGDTFKMLILTSPDNPTGGIYRKEQLGAIADWCIEKKIHLVVNEIYGMTIIDTSHRAIAADYDNPTPYYSFGKMMAEKQSPYLHLWYAFSKDLGISGFRVGLIHTYNEQLLKAYSNLNLTRMVSNYTQWVLQSVLEDKAFLKAYYKKCGEALTESYAIIANTLKKLGISYVPSRGSLFIWADFSTLLSAKTDQAQQDFWMELYKKTGILFTPANGFGHLQKGFYRIVISFLQVEDQQEAMRRLEAFVISKQEN